MYIDNHTTTILKRYGALAVYMVHHSLTQSGDNPLHRYSRVSNTPINWELHNKREYNKQDISIRLRKEKCKKIDKENFNSPWPPRIMVGLMLTGNQVRQTPANTNTFVWVRSNNNLVPHQQLNPFFLNVGCFQSRIFKTSISNGPSRFGNRGKRGIHPEEGLFPLLQTGVQRKNTQVLPHPPSPAFSL